MKSNRPLMDRIALMIDQPNTFESSNYLLLLGKGRRSSLPFFILSTSKKPYYSFNPIAKAPFTLD